MFSHSHLLLRTLGGVLSWKNPPQNILSLLSPVILRNKIPIVLHDSEDLSVSILEHYFQGSQSLFLVVLDITDAALLKASWLGKYNDPAFVHVILFNSVSVVEAFVEGLPERVWTPYYLLLVNTNSSVNGSRLLALKKFNYSPFLSLLQPNIVETYTNYHILTHEMFHPRHKILSHGTFSLDEPHTFATVFPDRFKSFYGYNLQLASWINDFPYLVPGPTPQETYGMGANMLNEISRRLNFSVTYYPEPEDQLWGEMVNGSWVGMVGQIWRRERDLCVNVMSIVEDRYQAVDFSVPYFSDSYSFIISIPLPPPRWWTIVLPFTWETWLGVATSVVIVSMFLALFFKVAGIAWTASNVVLQVVGTLLNQDISQPTFLSSLRIFRGTWLMLAMILSISYTGNLVAYITVPVKAHRLTSLRELSESSLTPIMADYGNFVPGALRSSEHPTLSALGKKLKLIPKDAYALGFQQVRKGTYALLEGTEFIEYLVIAHHQAATTYFLPEILYPIGSRLDLPEEDSLEAQVLVSDFMKKEGDTLHEDSSDTARPLSLQDLQVLLKDSYPIL
nr:glutamate receptor ionotropic, kainate 5-like [Cherax quadricarinatus]